MKLLEFFPESVELVVFGFGAAVLSLSGTYFERIALDSFQHGDLTLGLWAGYMGLVVLFVAYLVATDEVLPRLSALSTGADSA